MFTITELKNACKQHGIDPAPILETLKANKQPKEPREFWDCFIQVWHEFFAEKKGVDFQFLKRDWSTIQELYDLLRKRCESAGMEWTSHIACQGFKKYLQNAWNKDNWLQTNFTLNNVLIQFNAIATLRSNSTTDYKSNLAARING